MGLLYPITMAFQGIRGLYLAVPKIYGIGRRELGLLL